MISAAKNTELAENYRIFSETVSSLIPQFEGKFALMRRGTIVEYFNTPGEAFRAARSRYKDDLFSIQEVRERPADLGWYSRAPDNPPL